MRVRNNGVGRHHGIPKGGVTVINIDDVIYNITKMAIMSRNNQEGWHNLLTDVEPPNILPMEPGIQPALSSGT